MLTPSIELIIRNTLSMQPFYIALEGTAEFDAIASACHGMDDERLLASFQLTEVRMADGSLADAIVVSELPSAACASI